jgi:hypothetical protein
MYQVDQGAYWQAQTIYWGPKILIAILILVATWAVARAVKWVLQKAIDRTPALKKHMTGTPGETVGNQLGTIAKLLIWLVGIMAALTFLGIGQILAPINALTLDIFNFLPRLIGFALILFVGFVVARIAQRLVETVLVAANVDGLLARIGIGEIVGTRRTDPAAVPPGTTPGATRASIARAAGVLVFAVIIIQIAIAALQVLGIEAISGPAIDMLSQIYAALPRILAAALWIGVAFIIARFLKTIIEAILPPTGFDDAIRSTGVLPANASPSRIIGSIAMIAIILASSIEAAGNRARRQGDLRQLDHRRRHLPRQHHRDPGGQRHRRGRLRTGPGPLCDHRLVHRHRPDVHGPCRPDRDDRVRPDSRLGRGRYRARVRSRRAGRRSARARALDGRAQPARAAPAAEADPRPTRD